MYKCYKRGCSKCHG